ncbi:MAG: aldo/keto reductase [Alphaproteobacteria bacterium]|nr:aldo/keto reductase [Alphaproteobacteria bacterium]
MNYRKLGRTGITVSDIGFGAWGIGGKTAGATSYGSTDDGASLDALAAAFEHGITFYDTSNVYGAGHSETLIGKAFAGRRDRVIIATKAGRRDYEGEDDYSPAALERSLDESLKRLGTDHVDLLQLHSPPLDAVRRTEGVVASLEALRKKGKIRAFGFSTRSPADAIASIREFDAPVVQVNLNLVDQRAAQNGLLELAAERDVGIIARTPLCFGLLSGTVAPDTVFDSSDHRSLWPRAQIERWIEGSRLFVDAVADRNRQSKAQVALRYCLSFPAISSTIPGMLKRSEVEENARASDMGALSAAELADIARIYNSRSFFVAR